MLKKMIQTRNFLILISILTLIFSCKKDQEILTGDTSRGTTGNIICEDWEHIVLRDTWAPYIGHEDINDLAVSGNTAIRLNVSYEGGGSSYSIRVSKDTGKTWKLSKYYVPDGGDPMPTEVFALNKNTFFVIHSKGGYYEPPLIIKTEDGGNSWSSLSAPSCCPNDYAGVEYASSVYFFTQNKGFMGMNDGSLVRTNDGGQSWDSLLNMGQPIRFMDFPENDHLGYAITQEFCYKTTDSGNTWTQIYQHQAKKLNKLEFFDKSNGMIAGEGLFITTDGGNNWQQASHPDIQNANITGISYLDQARKMMVSTSSQVFSSDDKGASWTEICNSLDNSYTLKEMALCPDNSILLGTKIGVDNDTLRHYLLRY